VKEEIYFRAKPQTVAVSLPDKANANVLLGKPIPVSVKTSDYFATLIANAALGFDSFACRLAPVRDQYGLTYDISSAISNAAQKYSPWLISFTVNPNNIQKAVALVKTIVSHYVSDGITSTELANEKSHLAGTFLVSLRSQKQIAARLSEYDLLNLGAQYMDDYGKNLQAVKMTAVNSDIKKYFSMNDAITAISGTIPPDKK
jgi:zinc protease